jgi:hypothetical protein
LTNGTVRLGVSAQSDLSRGNTRTFRIVDNFEFLSTLLPESYCDPRSHAIHAGRQQQNWVYPITGSLQMTELIGAFLNLNQSGNLIGMWDASAAEQEIPTIVDVMEFTTKFTGGATPSVELTPKGKRFGVSKARFTTHNEREDYHRLRIIVKLPAKEWIPRTIAERRVVVDGVTVAGAPRNNAGGRMAGPSMRKASPATQIKSLVAEELAAEPTRELIEATIRFRNQARTLLVD